MAEPTTIIQGVECLSWSHGRRDLAGKKILITAGGTREAIDTVRFIGNPATGKMGVALALACHYRGAEVTMIHGVMEQSLVDSLPGVNAIGVTSAQAMGAALDQQFSQTDWLIMAAAVGDLQPQKTYGTKLPKSELPLNLALEYVPDLVGRLSQQKQPHQTIIGFAAQSGDIVPPAQAKLKRKGLDFIVANPIDQPQAGFGSDRNRAVVLDHQQQFDIAPCSKLEMAQQIIDIILKQQGNHP
jgi:phosphopantothenoylcysteine decarboxylase/phosphopantothenate--cysteine ligase